MLNDGDVIVLYHDFTLLDLLIRLNEYFIKNN